MKAFAVPEAGSSAVLVELDLPLPIPKADEVVVSVRAAGVTPTELLWYPSTHNKDGSPRGAAVPGHEFSGVVTAIGGSVSGFQVGDEVFGMNDWFANGATAQYCTAAETGIILKPARLSHPTAAATPVSALTAWQGLVDRARINSGDKVLIVGASGSVGLMAVQLAALHGCTVFGSATASAEPQLKALGCQAVLDYRSQPFQQHLHSIDVVFDTVGGDTLACAETILAPQGRMVTIAADAEGSNDPLIKAAFFIVESSAPQLQHIADLIAAAKLHAFIKGVLPLAQAAEAYSGRVNASAFGKLVLQVEFSTPTD